METSEANRRNLLKRLEKEKGQVGLSTNYLPCYKSAVGFILLCYFVFNRFTSILSQKK